MDTTELFRPSGSQHTVGGCTETMTMDNNSRGLGAGMIVLLVVIGVVLTFIIGNTVLYIYAQKNAPPRKKKPVSKKKMKREKLKQGVSAPGE